MKLIILLLRNSLNVLNNYYDLENPTGEATVIDVSDNEFYSEVAYVKENTKFEFIHIPVIITESGLSDVVYNDFYIGKNATVMFYD